MTAHDSETVDAPITNEELYIELKETKFNQHLTMGMVLLAAALTILSVGNVIYSWVALVGAGLFLVKAAGIKSRGWLTPVASFLDDEGVDETLDEARERLTDTARTDGGEQR